jgi:phosphopantothenoylcysteine decarboxylase / phosphopantothenate---cysteine ligase
MISLNGKHILVGVTGGIAAYKAAYLVRALMKAGAEVKVTMTESAARFVMPLTFSALSKNPVYNDLWTTNQSSSSDISTQHIDLANWADAMVIAPASANTIAKLTYGLSDNLLTVIALATTRPIFLAPTMDTEMYLNAVTQKNLSMLKERGFIVIPPTEGELASGLHGPGRLPEVETIVEAVESVLAHSHQDFKKKRILITAGPTHEAIDPVRFIGNRSSGKMGFALATAAVQRGAEVTLVAGPVSLETPRGVHRIDVESSKEMLDAVTKEAKQADVVVMAAAVADFAPAHLSAQKLKKKSPADTMELKLSATTDILASLGKNKGKKILVGFALETNNELSNAKEKLKKKNLDLVVLNSYSKQNPVFGSDMNTVTLLDRLGKAEACTPATKYDVAQRILDKIQSLI